MSNVIKTTDTSNLQKIRELEERLKEKLRERGEAVKEGGGWHDNSALDLINEEISVLEARIRELKSKL